MPVEKAIIIDEGQRIPWELRDVRPLRQPVPYRHPSGAVISVNLEPAVIEAIGRQLFDARTNL